MGRGKIFLGGEPTGAEIFSGVRGISKFLASGWRLSFILLVKKNLQFLLNLSQNLKSLYLMILKPFSMVEHNRQRKVAIVSFPKNILG